MGSAIPDKPRPCADSNGAFPETHWSLVLRAGLGEATDGARALNALCRSYWPPLYAFLRRQGHAPHDAEDLVQGFLGRVLERADFASVGPEKGRFRTFLLVSLRNHVLQQTERQNAQKRGGGQTHVSVHTDGAEALCGVDLSATSPELAYDRQWFRTVLSKAMARLAQEYRARGKDLLFEALAPHLDGAARGDYLSVGARLGMAEGTVAVSVHRLRLRLQELIRSEIMHTVASPEQADEEMQYLMEVWSR
ncbi:MAG: sigma-70 family RNA polymerase sigma factor [Verrucomicrobiales bacterium]|nr:sigma-70 family RNA polymerase sigma factor [Verrucomicrobiales bacterium]